MNPRLFCRERSFHKALLLTYSFDPVFFEQIVLPDLWAGRASDILVIGDRDFHQGRRGEALASGQAVCVGWCRACRIVSSQGAATHGATEGAVMIGSGNLTSCGWGG